MKTLPAFVTLLLLCIATNISKAQTSWKGTTSTTWSTASNWTAGVPTATTDAILGDASFTGINQPTISGTSVCKSLTIGGSVAVTLTVRRNTTVSGDITINANGSIIQTGYSLSLTGNWINNGTYSATGSGATVIFSGITQSLQGTSVTPFRKLTINTSSTTTLNNNVTITGGSSILTIKGTLNPNESPTYKVTGTALNINTNGNLKVRGATFADNYTLSGTLTVSSNSIVDYSATTVNQTISSTPTYSTLIISGSGIKSLAANLPSLRSSSISNGNILINAGTLDLQGFTANRGTLTTGGTISVANGATLKIGGTNTFPVNYSTTTLSLTSTVEYSGTTQIIATKTYGNLKFSSSSGAAVKTFAASAITIQGDLTSTIGSGSSVTFNAAAAITLNGKLNIGTATTFSAGSFTHIIAGNITNDGTLTGSTGTINMTGPASVISGSGTFNFNNLSISASNITADAASNIIINGNLSTTGPGTFTHASNGNLTMGGTTKIISGSGIIVNNLIVTGSVSVTSAMLSVTGNINVSGTLTGSANSIVMNGATKTISGAGTLSFSSLQVTGSVIASTSFSVASTLDISGSFSASSGSVTFTGTSVLNGTANLYSVVLNGTSLSLSSASVLGIANTLTITAGALNVTANKPNTVEFNGTGAQAINAITYHHLNITNGNTKTAVGAVTVNGNLAIGSTTAFNGSSYAHTIAGNWINNGTFAPATSTVQFTGATNTSITGATTFNILTINKSATSNIVTFNNNVNVPVINMTTGNVHTGSNVLTITNTRNGSGIILGTITRTHSFSTGTAYAFEGTDNTITFSSVSGVTSVTVNVTIGSISDFPNSSSINRVYNITVPSGTYSATLRLHYDDAELNGNNESSMQLLRFNGSNWVISGKTGNNTTSNYVEQSGLSNITNRWTIADNAGVIRWNGSVSSDWTNAANWTIVSGTPGTPPTANDIVQLGTAAFTNQPVITTAITVKSIVFGSAQAINLSMSAGGSLISNGNISGTWGSNAAHTINAGSQSLTINGDLIMSDGTNGHSINLNAASGTVTINGSLIQSGSANIIISGTTALNIKNDFNYTNGTFTAGSGTVTYNGTVAQHVGNVTYNHLVINKTSGIALLNATTQVNGNLAVTGELDINAASSITGNVIINASSILHGDGSTLNIGGNWTNNGTFNAGTGIVIFNGAGAQNISSSTFNDITINKASGTATLTGNIGVNSNLIIQSGSMDLLTYTANRNTVGGQFQLSAGSALLVGGANNFPQNYNTNTVNAASDVNYNGTVAQAVAGITYGNLQFSNGGANAKTFSASATIAGNLTINSSATVNGSSFAFNLWGNWINNGTFIPATSTVILNGAGKTVTGNTTFNRATIYGSYSVTGSNTTYNDLLIIATGGSYDTGLGVATANGDLINSGTLTSAGTATFSGTQLQTIRLINSIVSISTGIINFNGNVSPVLNSTTTPIFANLNINNTAGINPSVDWLVTGNMTVGSGAFFNGGISRHTIRGNFTNNGTVTSEGIMNFSPPAAAIVTVKFAGTAYSSTGSTNFANAGQVIVTGTPTILNDVKITNVNAVGITAASGWNMTGDFVIGSNSVFNAGSYSYTVGGDIESNGTLNGGSSTFTMTADGGLLTGSPNTSFYNFTIADSVASNSDYNVEGNFTNNGAYDGTGGALIMTGGSAANIGGTASPNNISLLTIAKTPGSTVTLTSNVAEVFFLNINSGTLFTSTNSITQDASGGTLLIEDGATLKLGGTHSLPGFSAYGLDLTSTVEYAGVNQTVGNAASYGNLTISTSGIKQASVPLIIQNNFTLSAGTFSSATSVTHTLGGNWLMTGGTYLNSSSTILFNGTGDQDISSTGAFNNLTVNKASGQINLSSPATINSTLNLTSGKIFTGSHNLTIGNSGSITNAGIASYIVPLGTGSLQQQVTSGGNKIFPVGLSSVYTPATVAFAGGSTADIIGIRMFPNVYFGGTSGNMVTANAVNATWMISEAIAGGSTATMTLQWPSSIELPGFNRTVSRLAQYTSTWQYGPSNIAAAGSNPYNVSRGSFSTFGPFTVANFAALPVKWENITGYNTPSGNTIEWKVGNETNNDYYVIEVSTDGINYSAAGTVKGAGTVSTAQHYQFIDKKISGSIHYYRIKQVDIDGNYSYSKSIKIISRQLSGFSIMNNPVADILTVSIASDKANTVSATIIDVTGKQLTSRSINIQNGNTLMKFDMSRHAAGMYYIVMINKDGSRSSSPFIKK